MQDSYRYLNVPIGLDGRLRKGTRTSIIQERINGFMIAHWGADHLEIVETLAAMTNNSVIDYDCVIDYNRVID